jgi:hypothetical protein
VDKAAGERAGHFACAKKTDGEWGCHESFVAGRFVKRKRKCTVNSQLEFIGWRLIIKVRRKKALNFYNGKQSPDMGHV